MAIAEWQEGGALYDLFGLCPDYKLVRTEGEWVEFYLPQESIAMWSRTLEDSLADKINISRERLHLNLHTVETERGIVISANFAVYHPTRTIFLQITRPSWDFQVK